MITSRAAPYASARYAAYVVGILFLAWFMSYVDRQVIGLLLPSLKGHMRLSDTQVSLLQGIAFASVFALAGLPLGRLADRTVRRNLIAAGLVFWSCATIACGLSTSFWQLFAARMCVGLGEACLAPAVVSMVADYFQPNQRGRAMSLIQAGAPIGSSSALFLGGLLLTTLAAGGFSMLIPAGWAAWKVVFIVAGAPGLLVAALVMTLREPPRRDQDRNDAQAAVHARLSATPPSILSLLKSRPATFAVVYGTFACLFAVAYATSSWAPTMLMRVYGLTPAAAGGAYATVMLTCSVTGYVLSGILSDALRRWRPADGRILIPAFMLPVEILAMTVFFFSDHVWLTIAILGVSSLATGLTTTSALAALQELAPSRLRGQVVAVYLLIANLVGLGLAPTLVGLVTDYVFADEMMLQKSMAAVGVSAALLGFVLALNAPKLYRKARQSQMDDEAARQGDVA